VGGDSNRHMTTVIQRGGSDGMFAAWPLPRNARA